MPSFQHKTLEITYLIHRLTTYPHSETAQKHELQTITHILQVNHFYSQQLNTLQNNMRKKKVQSTNNIDNPKIKWVLFICSHRELKTITKLLKASNINITFRTNNTIKNILDTHPKSNIYKNSRIYQLKCQTSSLKYTADRKNFSY
jgi:hypothetical protein